MIITHTDGTQTDSSKLNDFSAELLERTKEYMDFMCSRKIPFVLRFHDKMRKAYSGAGNCNDSPEDFAHVLAAIDGYIRPCGFRIVRREVDSISPS